jgi:nitrite reductase/ring-hydroxylating ferredoxin subunit
MSGWIEAANVAEFETSDRKLVDLGGTHQIGLFKVNGGYFAVSAWCSHQKTSIVHGDVSGHEIECPMHGARFDLRTGRHLSLPAVRPIPRYEVKVEGDKIFLKV